MKKIIIYFCTAFALVLIGLSQANAQTSSGIVAGINYSFYNNDDLNRPGATETIDYDNGLGFQLGYQWAFPISKRFDVNIGAMYNFIKGNNTVKSSLPGASEYRHKEPAMYFSAPLSVNYNIKEFYIGLGYEIGINADRNNPRLPHEYYAYIGQLGYKLGRVDIQLKYILGTPKEFNESQFDTDDSGMISSTKGYKSSNIGTAELSVIIPVFNKATKKEKVAPQQ